MPATSEQDRIQALAQKVNNAETELAIVNRDIEQSATELSRMGVDDPDNATEMLTKTKAKIKQFNTRISSLLTKAEGMISRFERGNV